MLLYWFAVAAVCFAGGWCCMKNVEFWQQSLESEDVPCMVISGVHSLICLGYIYINFFWLLPALKVAS
jgi:hypothetical protein